MHGYNNYYSSSNDTNSSNSSSGGYNSATIPQSTFDDHHPTTTTSTSNSVTVSSIPEEAEAEGPSFMTNNLIVLGVLMGIIVFIATLLVVVVIPQGLKWLRIRSLNSQRVLTKRRTLIHQWLITKTIPHQEPSIPPTRREGTSTETSIIDDDVEQGFRSPDGNNPTNGVAPPQRAAECMICMEEFRCGESVSWSLECDHVFHNTCLTKWLLQQANCPYCRQTMVPHYYLSLNATTSHTNNNNKGLPNQRPTRKEMKQLQIKRSKRSAATMYTLEDGFVVVTTLDDDDDAENDDDDNDNHANCAKRTCDLEYAEGSGIQNDASNCSDTTKDNCCYSTNDDNIADGEK